MAGRTEQEARDERVHRLIVSIVEALAEEYRTDRLKVTITSSTADYDLVVEKRRKFPKPPPRAA